MARKILRNILIFLLFLSLCAALIPILGYGIFHTGVLALLVFCALIGTTLIFWQSSRPHGILLRRICLCLCALAVVCGGILSGFLLYAAYGNPPSDATPHTVVVLGCQIIGDRPSRMLKGRLDCAAEYLLSHPQTPCIVSGGQGANEQTTEAEVMRAYLIERGVDASRIYLEENAENTRQNLSYSRALIERYGLPEQIIVVTDAYHQLRAQILARREGLSPTALSSFVLPGLVPSYWIREMFGVLQIILL